MSSLYKDAIADARKLREAAEQNAKNRIIEAVTPQLRRLIESQIAEGSEELMDDEMGNDLLDVGDTLDLLDDEVEPEEPAAEPMDLDMGSMDIASDGLGSVEIVPDEPEVDAKEYEDESQNKSVHVNITVEAKRNHLLRHRALRLVKALSEAKTRAQRNKIRKELKLLRQALIITENRQNKRLAKNITVILKESNIMRRRRRNSWLFEDAEGDSPENTDGDLDLDLDDDLGDIEDDGGGSGGDMSKGEAMRALFGDDGAEEIAEEIMDGGEAGDGDSDDDEDEISVDDEDIIEDHDEMGYESIEEADELDQCETDDNDEVQISEAMLRRALRQSRRRRSVNETRRRRAALNRRRRNRRLYEGEAKAMAGQFGGGSAGQEMFVDVDENTLLNALAEELGGHGNGTAAQGSASKMAGHFGGGSVKSGAVMEARRHRRTKRALNETRRVAKKNARIAKAARRELKESNLFNAKLLYVTKILQQHSLNNKQQRAIIEAMDNAKTQREAKLLFTSLNESLNKRKLNESRKSSPKKTLNESRTSYSNTSKRSGQAPRGNAVELDRWAVLAGIKK